MKARPLFTTILEKAFLGLCITIGFSNFIVVNVQLPIIGKWKEISAKQFFTPEGAKQTGKSIIEKQLTSSDKVEFEFKSDYTYTEMEGHIKFRTTTGTWSISGDQLTMVVDAEKKAGLEGRVYTISIKANTLTRTMVVKPPYDTMVYKQEDTSTRM